MQSNFLLALLLTSLAGLATTIGSVIGLIVKRPGGRFMALTLGFSAGVMLLVSFVELLGTGMTMLGEASGPKTGFGLALLGFFIGFFVIYVIDVLTPHHYLAEDGGSPHHPGDTDETRSKERLMRMGVLVAAGIFIHNFPEGMATFASTLANPTLGAAIAVAIAIHNIPEGIAVSVPIYAATGSRAKAFWWSFISGVSEPVGALIAGFILLPFLSPMVLGMTLASVAGLMVFIALDELLPVSHSYGHEHYSILGLSGGMIVMGLSLYLLK